MSSFVKIQNLNFTYDNLNQTLLLDVNINFHAGWTSICGKNGSGKTTLFKLLTKELKPFQGSIHIQGTVAYVPQTTQEQPQNLAIFANDQSPLCVKIKANLKLTSNWYSRWSSLSIGEKKRIQLAMALAENPDILLVDEPTNHLDKTSKQIIFNELKKHAGIGVLISHDRELLNNLCQNTIFIEEGELFNFRTNYDLAKIELDNYFSNEKQSRHLTEIALKRTKQIAQTQLEKIEKGKKKLSKKNINIKDHDAKEKINRARLFGADLADSRKRRTTKNKISRLKISVDSFQIKKQVNLGAFFKDTTERKKIFIPEQTLSFDFLTIKQPTIFLNQHDKLAITGDNGSGKSTLLKSWLELIDTRISYAPQDFSSSDIDDLTKQLSDADKNTRGQIMTLVSCFGSDPKPLAAKSPPSPGLWQKLMIATAIVTQSPILFLDEPTNHLDLDAILILENALKLYNGILVCISHDENLIKNICNLELKLTKNGNITDAELSHYEI